MFSILYWASATMLATPVTHLCKFIYLLNSLGFLNPNLCVLFHVQVILHSEVKATLHVKDVSLDLQAGFEHLGKDGRPTSSLFPLVIAPSSRAGILFVIRLSGTKGKSFLKVHFSSLSNPCNAQLLASVTLCYKPYTSL